MTTAKMSLRQKYRRPQASIKQEQEDDSDAEETQLGLRRSDGMESQIIHSGHFMVSSPHIEHPPKKGYDFDTVNTQTCQTYHFGKASMSHLSIDASLTKLFECMTLAYRWVTTHLPILCSWMSTGAPHTVHVESLLGPLTGVKLKSRVLYFM